MNRMSELQQNVGWAMKDLWDALIPAFPNYQHRTHIIDAVEAIVDAKMALREAEQRSEDIPRKPKKVAQRTTDCPICHTPEPLVSDGICMHCENRLENPS